VSEAAAASPLGGLLVLSSPKNTAINEACAALASVGVSAVQVSTLADALTVVQRAQSDLLAVEIGPNFPDGLESISRLRFVSTMPIVAVASPQDGALIARALEAGADGYLTAFPSDADELRDRLAALREGAAQRGPAPVSMAHVRELSVDFDRFEVKLAGQPVSLTPTEFRLLTSLMRAAGRVVSARQLLAEAQGVVLPESEAREIVKVHIRRLRAKIEPHQGANPYIVSVRGFGYLLERRAAPRTDDFLTQYAEQEEA
jgi:two-component system, OmpR family, KDP operon response regulator KdpE